jgi:hypothetical protein
MGDIGSDTESQLSMMINAYIALREVHPKHELLSLVELHDDQLGLNFNHGYGERWVRDSDKFWIQSYIRYTLALEAAVKDN